MFSIIMAALFACLAGFSSVIAYRAEEGSTRVPVVIAVAAWASALMALLMPALTGVVVIYWIALFVTRFSPFRKSFWQIAISLFLVASCFALIGMLAIPTWIMVGGWTIIGIVGLAGWFDDTFGDFGGGGM